MCQHALFSTTRKEILSPNYTSETNRRFYTIYMEKLELILFKEIGCTIKEIKVLLQEDSSMKTLLHFKSKA